MTRSAALQETGRQTTLLVTLAAAFVATQLFSDALTRGPYGIAALWPCTALLAVGLMALGPPRRLILTVVVGAAHVAICLALGDTPERALIFTAVNLAEAWGAREAVRRAFGGPPRVRTMRQLALLVTVIAPVVAVTAGVAAALLALLEHQPFLGVWRDWFVSGALGMALIVPAVLVLIDSEHRRTFHRSAGERAGLFLLMAVLTAAVFHDTRAPLPFVLFPAAILCAFRLGPRGAAEAALTIAAVSLPLGVWNIWQGHLLAPWNPPQMTRLIQCFVTVVFVTALAAGLALAQQERLRRLLVRREQLTRSARARALAAAEAKTEFLATMSHEIRTPLNSILGFAQLLAGREDLPADAQRQVGMIDTAGAALLTVVSDILDVSRVDSGQVELLLQPASASAVLHDAVGIVQSEAEGKNLAVEIDVVDPVEGLHDLDALRLRQVLLNLLNNAVKFTERGKIVARLVIEPGEVEDRLRFEVIDTGVGVPIEDQARLFQRFVQLDSGATRAYGGAGLGLAISKSLVELMGGRIGADSAPGHGSCFWFELPAAEAEPLAAPTPEAARDPRAARILLVDDHPMNREIGVGLLRLAGCHVETAENGRQALAAAARGHFDIILMDIHMPEMDGLAATRAIRGLEGEAGRVPIIAMSADALPQQVERCFAAGMVDHIAKPVQREVLYAKIGRWLEAGR
ncbi:histidine kinase [Caulobacter sp. D4A]|uniref:ATP-binding protein n=1 Tax=unclassified Caulobacter TaxID=2648921 RepID=UPI000D734A8B|nr:MULTISPECIES: ATP-binding protein [unclassified Caulobacter]PXA75059.1 histidine kinase [Caulobacter sp. D4A]PXA94008.1 histidine kinase [Caulobacter sp. D5]